MIAARSVKLPAQWLDGDAIRRETAMFQLGPGPCGRIVSELGVVMAAESVSVFQQHDDGSRKVFIYPLGQLTGRIEVEAAE